MDGHQIKHKVAKQCKVVRSNGGVKLIELEAKVVEKNDAHKIQVVAVGPPNTRETLTFLLLGETGAGKTTIVNVMINIFYGIHIDDDFRFLLKDQMEIIGKTHVHSQTDYVTCYLINTQEGMNSDCNIMMIDTPGFNDTRSEGHQKIVTERISKFLLNEFGVDSLHCIGLVAKANQNRISKIQVEILDEFSLHLANDLSPITKLLATFASDDNFVCEVVKQAGVKYSGVYEFDNWPLYVSNKFSSDIDQKTKINHAYRWDNMYQEYMKFIKDLKEVTPVSLKRTRELQKAKKTLDSTKIQLIDEIQRTAFVVKSLNKLKDQIQYQKEETEGIKWQYKVEEIVVGTREVQDGYHAHNCNVCSKTCINICENPSNVKAGIVGTTTGIASACAVGIASSIGSGALIGAEAGIFGGPIGAIVGSCVGAASGLAVGVLAGIKSRKGKLECPVAKSETLCEVDNCQHKFSDHNVEIQSFVESTEWKEKEDPVLKAQYDKMMERIKRTESQIKREEETMQTSRDSLTSIAVNMLSQIKNIDELSLKANCITAEKVVEELSYNRDEEEVKILRMYLSALKLLDKPKSKRGSKVAEKLFLL